MLTDKAKEILERATCFGFTEAEKEILTAEGAAGFDFNMFPDDPLMFGDWRLTDEAAEYARQSWKVDNA